MYKFIILIIICVTCAGCIEYFDDYIPWHSTTLPSKRKQYFIWDSYELKPRNEIPDIKGRAYYPHEILKRKLK